ncbi:ketopantoate reductase family protein [Agromyces archimandritae]|uniref:ketopantoate reductase family protein n=1 Tax=Agromyces archimandritae TaxID=2781962 RepID=UPI001FD042A2|nr:2-dehydropantoate 2-reductase [Agromyces archimandritae]
MGAGALGGMFAGLLARSGHEVRLTARGETLDALAGGRLRLTGAYGEVTARVDAGPALSERPELALLCTKAQDAPAALAANAPQLAGIPLVVVQNGLGGVETARAAVSDADVFGLLTLIAAQHTEPGAWRVTAAAPSFLGRGDGPVDAAAHRIASVLSEAVPVRAIDDFRGAQWTKLVVNMLNAVPAIVGRSVQEVVDDPALRRVVTASMRETVRVGIARGIRFGALQGLDDRRLRTFARLPLAIGGIVPLRMRRAMGDVPNLGSTQQSLARGRPSEIDHLNGAVVREAEAVGADAPVNRALTALVHEAERSGPLPAARVSAILD